MSRSFFHALIIAPLLLAVCFYPGQIWLSRALPGLAGHATADPGLTILDIPIHLPFPVDLLLVPGLFIVIYSITVLIAASRTHLPAGNMLASRLRAIAFSVIIILLFVAVGSLVSWLVRGYLPAQMRNNIASFAVSADFHFQGARQPNIDFRGDVFSFLGLIIAMVVSIRILSKKPAVQQRFRLTREQRMTPYQRMLLERRHTAPRQIALEKTSSPRSHRYSPSHGICRNAPLLTMQPEPVNYRPLE
jgi:hypothetical protein